MPISAQEHRVRIGAYNSGRGAAPQWPKYLYSNTRQHCGKPVTEWEMSNIGWSVALVIISLLHMSQKVLLLGGSHLISTTNVARVILHLVSPYLTWVYSHVCLPLIEKSHSWVVHHPWMAATLYLVLTIVVSMVTAVSILLIAISGQGGIRTVLQYKPQILKFVLTNVCKLAVCFSFMLTMLTGFVIKCLLMLSGDVESNPGPISWSIAHAHFKERGFYVRSNFSVAFTDVVLLFLLSTLLIMAGDVEINPGPRMDEPLTLNDLPEVYEMLKSASTDWFNLGLALDILHSTLKNLSEEYRGNNDTCLRESLAFRLQSGSRLTWGDICSCLRRRMVGRNDVAEEIEEHLRGTEFFSRKRSNSGIDTPPPIKRQKITVGTPTHHTKGTDSNDDEASPHVGQITTCSTDLQSASEVHPLTLTKLKEETGVTDSQLRQMCSDEDLTEISEEISNWTLYAKPLGLKPAEVADIRTNAHWNYQQKTEQMLLKWKHNSADCSYSKLVKVAIQVKDGEVARKLCKKCARLGDAVDQSTGINQSVNDSAQKESLHDSTQDSIGSFEPPSTTVSKMSLEQMESALKAGDETSLDDLCALPVEDVWYPLGLWLGVEEETLRDMKKQARSKSVQALFSTFLQFPIGTQKYTEFETKLPCEMVGPARKVFETNDANNFKAFIQKLRKNQQVLAKELIQSKSLKYIQLVRALVKVGKRNDAEKICSQRGVSLTDYLDATDPGSNPPDCVLRYASYLKDRYRQMSVLPDPDWPPIRDTENHYTNLALIDRDRGHLLTEKESRLMARDYAYGKVDKIIGSKRNIQIVEIFYPIINPVTNESRLTVLIDGAPGVGKTTLTRKICIDWAGSKPSLDFCQLLVLVPLREVSQNECRTVADLLPADDDELKSLVADHLQRTSGENTLIIFDGFDELSSKQRRDLQSSFILNVIKGSKLHRCSVLVTSRPYASGPLRDLNRVNRHVEVLGFTKSQIAACVQTNFKLQPKEVYPLLVKLNERLDIGSLCYIPLNCRIVLYVYKVQQFEFPNTLTELYEIFILHTIKRYTEKIKTKLSESYISSIREAKSLNELPEPEDTSSLLSSLSKTAFKGMEKDQLVFGRKELGVSMPEDLLSLGLLTSMNCFTSVGELDYFQFLHLTIQEFLAARYIASNEVRPDERWVFFKNNIQEERFRMTFLFLAGLSKLKFIPPNLANVPLDQLFSEGKEKALFLTQLAYESKRCSTWILSHFGSSLDMSGVQLSRFDCLVLAHFISSTPESRIWESINLSDCSMTDEHLKAFSTCDANQKKVQPLKNVKCFILENNPVSSSGILPIIRNSGKLLQTIRLTSVRLSTYTPHTPDCKITVELFKTLSESTLRRISFFHSHVMICRKLFVDTDHMLVMCPKATQLLSQFMECTRQIMFQKRPIIFQDCNHCSTSGASAVSSLCALIHRSDALAHVNFESCRLSFKFVSMISNGLIPKAKLKVLNLHDNDVSETTVRELLTQLPNNSNLIVWGLSLKVVYAQLIVREYDRHSSDYETLFSCLLKSSLDRFRAFDLTSCHRISDCIQADYHNFETMLLNCNIRELNLSQCSLSNQAVSVLASILTVNEHLVSLNLSSNHGLSAKGVESVITSRNSLDYLDISNNFIEQEAIIIGLAVGHFLRSSKSIQVLKLRFCNLNDKSLEHIASGLSENTSLKELDLSGNETASSSWIQIFQAIKETPLPLTKLAISRNCLPTECFSTLNEIISSTPTLTAIDISYIHHSTSQCRNELIESLSRNMSLLNINLSYTPITLECAKRLFGSLIRSDCIQILDLSYCQFDADVFHDFLSNNQTIKVLGVRKCDLTDRALEAISVNLSKQNSSLQVLDVSGNVNISSGCWEVFLKVLCENVSLTKLTAHQCLPCIGTRAVLDQLASLIAKNKGLQEIVVNRIFIEENTILKALVKNMTLRLVKVTNAVAISLQDLRYRLDQLIIEESVPAEWDIEIILYSPQLV